MLSDDSASDCFALQELHRCQRCLYSIALQPLGKGEMNITGSIIVLLCARIGGGHICKKCFCHREPFFLGRIFLILRINFPNMEEDFPIIEEKFS